MALAVLQLRAGAWLRASAPLFASNAPVAGPRHTGNTFCLSNTCLRHYFAGLQAWRWQTRSVLPAHAITRMQSCL